MPSSGDDGQRHVDSSGEDLTPPPHSPEEPTSPSTQVTQDLASHQHHHRQQSGIVVAAPDTVVHHGAAANNNDNNNNNNNTPEQPEKPPRKKPGRKPGWSKALKEANAAAAAAAAANGTTSTTTPEASTSTLDGPRKRAPRKPKDPNAPPMQRRKRKTESLDPPAALAIAAALPPPDLQPRPTTESMAPPPPEKTTESGNGEGIQRTVHSFFAPAPPAPLPPPAQQPTQPPVRTSGQNYDPIRSNYDPVRETIVSHGNPFSAQGSPNPNVVVPPINRASASPSISSLVDPPSHALTSPSIAAQSFFNQQVRQRDENQNSLPASPQPNRVVSATAPVDSPPAPKPTAVTPDVPAKKVDSNGQSSVAAQPSLKKVTAPGSTATSSTAASPKVKPKDKDTPLFPAPPPLPGQGLMQGNSTEYRAPTVILTVPMNGEVNKYVNFTRLAEEQYGWDALHPRLAAQRDRLARVAAAGAALERNGSSKDSGDDMSLDSEGEGDNSNVEMGGMSDARTGTDGGAKKVRRKRKNKEDEYDKDDGFVDDSELLWEEQAAAANDGFFVYSGPLVPETEKPSADLRPDGAPKRGRGRGSRGGRMSSSSRGTTNPKPGREGLPLSGPGSRGGSTTRKPRITKADRARMEQEKLERERMGAASMQQTNGYGGMIPLSNLGTTPMVFNN